MRAARLTAKDKPQKGKIPRGGSEGRITKDGKRAQLQVKKIGDQVLFTSYAGDKFKIEEEDQKVLLMREDDILAVIDW